MKKIHYIYLAFFCLLYSCDLAGEKSNAIDLNSPGSYNVGKSFTIDIPIHNASVNVKVTSITVYEDLSLGLNVLWTMYVDQGYSITKYSDYNNDNMNLSDNIGNTYYMTDALYAAGSSVTLGNGESCTGTFVYPEPNEGITTLYFNDDDNNKSLSISVTK